MVSRFWLRLCINLDLCTLNRKDEHFSGPAMSGTVPKATWKTAALLHRFWLYYSNKGAIR
jgi:hypothetical protein